MAYKFLDYLAYCAYFVSLKKNRFKQITNDVESARNVIFYVVGLVSAIVTIVSLMIIGKYYQFTFEEPFLFVILMSSIYVSYSIIKRIYTCDRIELIKKKYKGQVSYVKAAFFVYCIMFSLPVILVAILKYAYVIFAMLNIT